MPAITGRPWRAARRGRPLDRFAVALRAPSTRAAGWPGCMSVGKDDGLVGHFVQSPWTRSRGPRVQPTLGTTKESLRANPSRGGDAKPGISRRPPGYRPQTSRSSRYRHGGPEMPYIIRPRGIRNVVATLLGSAMLLAAAPAVSSAAECSSSPASPVSTALSQFGDDALYSLLSGSSFESGTQGWSLSNAYVVDGGANGVIEFAVDRPGRHRRLADVLRQQRRTHRSASSHARCVAGARR